MTKPKYQTNVKLQSSNDKQRVKNQRSKIKMTNQNEKMWCEAPARRGLAGGHLVFRNIVDTIFLLLMGD